MPKIAIVFCPYFSLRSPHLGLSRIYTALEREGFKTDVYDLDVWLRKNNRDWYHLFQKAFNIGREFERVSFVLGLEALIHHLYGEEFPDFNWDEFLHEAPIRPVPDFAEIVTKAVQPIVSEDYDFVLFSTYISNVPFSLSAAKMIRERTNARVIFGGPGSSIPETAKFLLGTGFIDIIVIGEGELTISNLLRQWEGGSRIPGIPGVAHLSNSELRFEPRDQIQNISDLPFTDFPTNYQEINYVPMEASRGCIMNCGFCSESSFWKTYRIRSIESIMAEIDMRAGSQPSAAFMIEFVDSLMNPSESRLRDLSESFIKRSRLVEWMCEMRPVQWMSHSLAQMLFQAGCRSVNLGAETFIPERLRYLRKGTHLESILATIEALSGAGIHTNVHRMSGISGETDQEILEMYDTLREFKRRIHDPEQWHRIQWGAPDILRVEPLSLIHI